MDIFFDRMDTLCNCVHPENALPPMVVTELGIVTDEMPLHPQNALIPMFVTDVGMVIDVMFAHPENALPPIIYK